jgi:hypothetical protein
MREDVFQPLGLGGFLVEPKDPESGSPIPDANRENPIPGILPDARPNRPSLESSRSSGGLPDQEQFLVDRLQNLVDPRPFLMLLAAFLMVLETFLMDWRLFFMLRPLNRRTWLGSARSGSGSARFQVRSGGSAPGKINGALPDGGTSLSSPDRAAGCAGGRLLSPPHGALGRLGGTCVPALKDRANDGRPWRGFRLLQFLRRDLRAVGRPQ